MALYLMKLKEWTKAKLICSKIKKADRDVVEEWYRRGECYMHSEKFDKARDIWEALDYLSQTNLHEPPPKIGFGY